MKHIDPAQFAPKRQPFGTWLLAQVKRDDDVGAIAKIAFTDRRFPREGDYRAVSKYLGAAGAEPEALQALEDAETDWLAL